MTLVVGRIVQDDIHIESDSKVTDKNSVKNDPLSGVIKTLILHPFISLSYAGHIYFAEKAIKRFFDERIVTIPSLLKILLEINIESNYETDFVVASILDKKPRIDKIVNGVIEDNLTSFWIGDIEGFELYQKKYHDLISEGKEIPESMNLAFKTVIDEPKIESIDHYQISLNTDKEINPGYPVFMYKIKLEIMSTGKQEIKFNKPNEYVPIPLGSAAIGGYGISYLVTASPNYHGVAIHYTHGNFGVLFCPQINLNKGVQISNVNGSEFVEKIKKEYSIPLMGFIKNSDTSIQYIDNRNLP